jgi:hypothetical protein
MGLKVRLTAAEYETLAAPLKEHYKAAEGSDGGYTLDADGVGDVEKLNKALKSERDNAGKLAKELAQLRDNYKDIDDPEKAREALTKIRELEEKKLLTEGNVEELLKQRTETMRKDYESKIAARDKKLEAQVLELKTRDDRLAELLIDGAVSAAGVKAGVRKTAVDDLKLRARTTFRLKDGKPIAMNGDEVVYGKDGVTPMTPEEWVGSLTTTAPHLFEASSGSGASNTNGGSASGFVLSRDQARNPQTYQAAKERAKAAGQELVIAEQ